MSALERYKKKGGFIQILTLIESSEPAKAEKFLALIAQESKIWAQTIKEKSLTIEKMKTLGEQVLSESLDTIPVPVLANALIKEPIETRNLILPCLNQTSRKKIELAMADNPSPRPGDILACQLRIISACRAAITDGRVKQNQLPKDLQIDEDIETTLSQETWTQALNNLPQEGSPTNLVSQTAQSVSTNSSHSNSNEVTDLKKRLQKLSEENQHLKNQILDLQDKIIQIKKVVG